MLALGIGAGWQATRGSAPSCPLPPTHTRRGLVPRKEAGGSLWEELRETCSEDAGTRVQSSGPRQPQAPHWAWHHLGLFCPPSTKELEGQGLQAPGSPGASSPDHLLADAYSGHDGSPEMQPPAQNKRRLSLISDGRCEEAVLGQPAGEGLQPRVYTISGEPALLPSPEAEAIELGVVKGRRSREQHPHHHSQPLRASPGGSHEDISTPCQSWAGSRQGSKECPGCAQLAPSPSPRAFALDQPSLPQTTSRRKKLERMYSVDRVSGEGHVVGVGRMGGMLVPASASSSHCEACTGGGCPGHSMQVKFCCLVSCPTVGFGPASTESIKEYFLEEGS